MTVGLFIDHFWHFFFFGPGQPVWYERAVWGNVVATIPLALMGAAAFFWHRGVVRKLHARMEAHETALAQHAGMHAEHGRRLLLILDALDPGTDGGITEIHAKLETITDVIDVDTPGGLRVILDRIEAAERAVLSKTAAG